MPNDHDGPTPVPHRVDHDDRRTRIAEAVAALAGQRGVIGVTVRDVAARAGVSVGAVQRCFATKDEMLLFALDHVGERVLRRTDDSGPPPATPEAGLADAVSAIAMVDDDHRDEAKVWLAFVAQTMVSPPLAATLRERYAELHALLTRLVADIGGPADAALQAHTLLALADGLTLHVLVEHLTPRQATDALTAHVAGLGAPPT